VQSKLVILRSFESFLDAALHSNSAFTADDEQTRLDMWFLSGAFPSEMAFQSFMKLIPTFDPNDLPVQEIAWKPRVDNDIYEHGFYAASTFFPLIIDSGRPTLEVTLKSLLDTSSSLTLDNPSQMPVGDITGEQQLGFKNIFRIFFCRCIPS
jgi:hypothetical protein